MAAVSTGTMEASIVRAISVAAEEIRERAIQDAVADFESRLRESVLKHAIELTKFYQIERDREGLIITVRHQEQPK